MVRCKAATRLAPVNRNTANGNACHVHAQIWHFREEYEDLDLRYGEIACVTLLCKETRWQITIQLRVETTLTETGEKVDDIPM